MGHVDRRDRAEASVKKKIIALALVMMTAVFFSGPASARDREL
jgi:hypothetical protein